MGSRWWAGARRHFHDHTAVPVPLFAFGPGSQELAGVRDNTEVPRVLARLLDLDFLGHHPTHGPLGEPASSGAGR
jgi:alkaline phosphatase